MKLKQILDSDYSKTDIREYLYSNNDDVVLAANKAVGMAVAYFVVNRQNLSGRDATYFDVAMSNKVVSRLAVFYMINPEVVKAEATKYGKYLTTPTKVVFQVGSMGLLGLSPYYTEQDIDFISDNDRIYVPMFAGAIAAIVKHTAGDMVDYNV